MEWIRISTHKLKIMLSAEDARHYALDCEKADYADIMTRGAFREILTDIQKEADFDTGEDKIYIQMYPSKEGGCELFVTRMGLAFKESSPISLPHAIPPPQIAKSPQTVRKRVVVLFFERLDNLLALCRRIASGYKGESEIWQDEKNKWWLILSERGDPMTVREDFRFAREYGRMASAEEARILLPEHGRLLCPSNAIEIFSKF